LNEPVQSGLTDTTGDTTIISALLSGAGTLTINGGILYNTSGSVLTLSTNKTQSRNGNFTFTGSSNLDLGTAAYCRRRSAMSLAEGCTNRRVALGK
jgi:hypothetical protein